MSTPRSSRLDPLRHLARQREDAAARELAEAQRAASQKDAQQRELEKYLGEYLLAPLRNAVPGQLSNRHAFVTRLREAIAFQQRAAQQARALVETRRGAWLQRRLESSRIERLRERYVAAEHRAAEHRTQKYLDEFANRRFVAAHAEGGSE